MTPEGGKLKLTVLTINPATLTSWAALHEQFGPVVAPVRTGESDFLGAGALSPSGRDRSQVAPTIR